MYVIDLVKKEKVKASIDQVETKDLKNLVGFDFNWVDEKENYVYKLTLKKTNKILGLVSLKRIYEELRVEICLLELSKPNVRSKKKYDRIAGILIAHACKESFQNGFLGFVSLIPKTRLIDHYVNKYGFTPYGKHLVIELESSEKLMNEYLIEGNEK